MLHTEWAFLSCGRHTDMSAMELTFFPEHLRVEEITVSVALFELSLITYGYIRHTYGMFIFPR